MSTNPHPAGSGEQQDAAATTPAPGSAEAVAHAARLARTPRPTLEPATRKRFDRGEWIDEETITAGSARQLLAWAEANLLGDRPCAVNPILTNAQGIDIMRKGIAGYADGDAIWPIEARNIKRIAGARR